MPPPPPHPLLLPSPPFALVPPLDQPLYLSLSIRQSFNTVVSPRPPGRRDRKPSARLMGREICCSAQSGLHPAHRNKMSRLPIEPFCLRITRLWCLKATILLIHIDKNNQIPVRYRRLSTVTHTRPPSHCCDIA